MKKLVLVPDSFKGNLTSAEICAIMEGAIHSVYPEARVAAIPVADGGEGSVDCFLAACGGQRVTLEVRNPYGEPMEAAYGLLPDGTAVIEMAACAGLPLVRERKAAEKTTTYGVGQLIAHAASSGCRRIVVGLGGSATNDGGAGAAAALGVRFLDEAGSAFVPVGESLFRIRAIDPSGLLPCLSGVELVAMCDIDNPLCGERGAARVFGPQKGADEATVRLLDQGLAHLAALCQRDLGASILALPGAGAAGGMGGGMVAFLGARLEMGIETVLDTVGFDTLVRDADLVLTGEGRLDASSLGGKVVVGVARRAKRAGVPAVAVVGDIGPDIQAVYDLGVCGVFSTNRVATPMPEAKQRIREDLRLTVENLMRYTGAVQRTEKENQI